MVLQLFCDWLEAFTVGVISQSPVGVIGEVSPPTEFLRHARFAHARFAGDEVGCHASLVSFCFRLLWRSEDPGEILRQPDDEVVIDGDHLFLLERAQSLTGTASIRHISAPSIEP